VGYGEWLAVPLFSIACQKSLLWRRGTDRPAGRLRFISPPPTPRRLPPTARNLGSGLIWSDCCQGHLASARCSSSGSSGSSWRRSRDRDIFDDESLGYARVAQWAEPQDRAPSGGRRRVASRVQRAWLSCRIARSRVPRGRASSPLLSLCSIESSQYNVGCQEADATPFGSIAAHRKPARSRPTVTTILLCALPAPGAACSGRAVAAAPDR